MNKLFFSCTRKLWLPAMLVQKCCLNVERKNLFDRQLFFLTNKSLWKNFRNIKKDVLFGKEHNKIRVILYTRGKLIKKNKKVCIRFKLQN